MLSRIVSIDPRAPGGFAPLLAGATPPVGAPLLLGYELGGAACGALAADCFAQSVTVRWLCVDRFCRRRGIGGTLLKALCELAAENGAQMASTVVSLPPEEAVPVEKLLRAQGFRPGETSPVYSFPLSAVTDGPLAPLLRKGADRRAVPLRELSGLLLRETSRLSARSGGPSSLAVGPEGLLPQSFAWLEGSVPTGCLLLAPCGSGIELRWLHAKGPAAVQGLLTAAASAVSAVCPPDTVIHAAAMTPSVDQLIQKLAGARLTLHPPLVQYVRLLSR